MASPLPLIFSSPLAPLPAPGILRVNTLSPFSPSWNSTKPAGSLWNPGWN